MREIRFSELCNFFDKQWLATEVADRHRYTLYGGCRGPGKSHWLRWYAIRRLLGWAARGFRGVRVGLFCEDYPSLKERQIVKIAAQFPAWLGKLKETKSDGLGFHLLPEYGGGTLALRNLDDPSKYQSAEFAGIEIDELTKNREDVFHFLRGSLRWPGLSDTYFAAASNPNGLGQGWVRSYFVEKQLPKEMLGHEGEFAYLPASPMDNPYLDKSYWDMLNSLPDKLRQAWRDGNWYVQMEDVVYPEFGEGNFTDDEPVPSLPIEIAFDDGYIDPRAILFIQRYPDHVLVFAEMYHTQHLGETCAGEIIEFCKLAGLSIPSIAHGSHEAVEFRRYLVQNGIACGPSAPVPIVEGVNHLRGLVLDGNGHHSLRVHRRCQSLLREIFEGYQYPPDAKRRDVEVPIDKNNHALDALRVWAWHSVDRRALKEGASPTEGYRG